MIFEIIRGGKKLTGWVKNGPAHSFPGEKTDWGEIPACYRVQASPASLRCDPWARYIYPSLVLFQPRKTCPCLTERLLMGRKESNQTNKRARSKLVLTPVFEQLLLEF